MARKDEKLYGVWLGIKHRCNIPTATGYANYGGRGIKVCKEWDESYEVFKEWAISNGYTNGLTIDRIDTNGNYEPSNCRWVDKICQANNTRRNVCIEWNGEKCTISQWSRKLGIPEKKLWSRLRLHNMSADKAFATNENLDETRLTYNGETHNLKEWSKITGIHVQTLSSRIHKLHWSIEKALTTPPKINKRNIHRYKEVANLNETSRGTGGFGSSGS